MVFDHYLECSLSDEPMQIDESWGQGRTTFGGLSVALILNKIQFTLDPENSIREINVNFCGALMTDVPFTIHYCWLSRGKSVSQVVGQVVQNDRVVTQLTACFGIARPSNIEVSIPPIHLDEVIRGRRFNYIKGVTPEFGQHVEFVYDDGGFPMSSSKNNRLSGWVRFKSPPKGFTEKHLLALVDAWPPAVLQRLKSPAPWATITWNLDFVIPLALLDEPLTPESWIFYDAEVKKMQHGYAHTEAGIYHPGGQLIARSRQLVAVYDRH